MIVILDYQSGNVNSIQNMIKRSGYNDVIISSDPKVIVNAEKIIIAGVGHFDYGMAKLKQADFFGVLEKKVLQEKVPVLGICLGMQMLSERSEEGSVPGLGWVEAETIKFNVAAMNPVLKIPHFGWTNVRPVKESRLLEGMDQDEDLRFYFAHSYHISCRASQTIIMEAEYGYKFTAAVEQDNIIGVQFHPEKSHKYGMKILQNFVTNY